MSYLYKLESEIANYSAAEKSALIVNMIDNEILLSLSPEKKMISASCIKLFILLALLHQFSSYDQLRNRQLIAKSQLLQRNGIPDSKVLLAEDCNSGKYLERTIYELAFWMYTISDNVSTNACIDAAGGFDAINEYIQMFLPECESTVVERYMLDSEAVSLGKNNYTSVQDMYTAHRFIEANDKSKLGLSADVMSVLHKILGQTRDLSRIMGRIFDYDRWTGKGGGLSEFSLVHDAGTLTICGYQYFIAFFTCYNEKDKPEVIDDMARWGRMFYDCIQA